MNLKREWSGKLFIAGILFIGAFLRFFDVNWDSGYMLHPDERFLVMLTEALQLPQSLSIYLNPHISQLNPENVNYGFYVYGVFPLFLTKLLAVALDMGYYNDLALVGRTLSSVADTLVIALVYHIAQLFEKQRNWSSNVKYWAAFAYAISVLPIQLSHFYTVDPFLNLFVTTAIYCMLRFYFTHSILAGAFSGVFFAAALASKISAVYVAPLLAGLYVFAFRHQLLEMFGMLIRIVQNNVKEKELHSYLPGFGKTLLTAMGIGIFIALTSYVSLRFFNPYYFENPSFLDFRLNDQWLTNIEQLKSFEGIGVWYPPAIQWMTKPPVTYALWNMAILGLGIPLFLLTVYGLSLFVAHSLSLSFKRKKGTTPHLLLVTFFRGIRSPEVLLIVVWILAFFLYQSTQFVKALRYFFFLYPLLALAAGYGISHLLQRLQLRFKTPGLVLPSVITACSIIWPLMFLNIYVQPHSRVEASEWIHENLEDGYVLSEHWDDPLPLRVPGSFKQFPGEQMEVFGADTDDKFLKMQEQLSRGQYYILSSNRGWGSMPTVPEMYPRMGQFYEELFAGELGYQVIKEFTVYPSLEYLGIPLTLPDDWADETFTVYDHPKVIIMENIDASAPSSIQQTEIPFVQ